MGQKDSKSVYLGVERGGLLALLRKKGITLSKEKGQHFLLEPSLLAHICDVGEVGKNDDVLEIGAGIGNLTAVLAERAHKVLALEIDGRFKPFLDKKLAAYPDVIVLFEDFLKMGKERLGRYLSTPLKVVANIPFYLTAPILQKLVEFKGILSLAVLTVQKEVADKLLPPPNRYATPLSLYITYHFKIERSFVIPKSAFTPPPDVDARVIKMTPCLPPVSVEREEEFFHFLRNILRYKRKNLRNALQNAGYFTSSPPVALDRRVETLSWEELKCLFLSAKKLDSK